ncbi:unnamed protein product, partial [Closterium sp. NIES-54]
KKLFNRARLLIGPSSLALSSLLFLPFNAALLELLPPPALNTTSAPAGGSAIDPEGFGTLAAAAGIVRYAVPCDPSLKSPAAVDATGAAGAAAESAGAAGTAESAGATGSAGTAGLGSGMSCRLQLVEGALDEIMSAHFGDVKRSGVVEGGAGGGIAPGAASSASSATSSPSPSPPPPSPPPSPAAAAAPPPPQSMQPPSPPPASPAAAAPPPAVVVTHPTRSSPGSEKDEGPQPSPWYELNEQQWDEHREKIAEAEGGAGAFETRLFNLTVPPEKDETEDGAGGGQGGEGAGGGVSEEGSGNKIAEGKSRAPPLFPDYSDHIPGTRLHTKRQVVLFNKWMECVLREGRWVFNATPRTLPWEYTGFMNMCDHKQVEKRKGKATWGADELVLKGTSPDKWT